MRIKVDQFCTLATSPSWQAWLYHHHVNLYRKFIRQIQGSRGCNQNRELMTEVLQEIDKAGGDALAEFLQKHYPHMISGQQPLRHQREDSKALDNDGVFQHYNPNILTYPRRQIFVGPKSMLKGKVQEFLLDKIRGDHIIIGERAYIEYLEKSDKAIADQIPIKNWLIAAYRQR